MVDHDSSWLMVVNFIQVKLRPFLMHLNTGPCKDSIFAQRFYLTISSGQVVLASGPCSRVGRCLGFLFAGFTVILPFESHHHLVSRKSACNTENT